MAMPSVDCDVCGLPDPYDGGGDGIGSCECPRCDGGEAAASSVLCICPPDDIDGYWDDDAEPASRPAGELTPEILNRAMGKLWNG